MYVIYSGSRQRLLQSRRLSMRDYCVNQLNKNEGVMAHYSTKRIDLITNFGKYLN